MVVALVLFGQQTPKANQKQGINLIYNWQIQVIAKAKPRATNMKKK